MNRKIYELINNYSVTNEYEKIDKKVMLDFIRNNEDVLTRDNKIGHFTASAWIVNKEKTKVLMVHHNIFNSWAFVGGHADGDGNLFRVVNKEIEEETGLTNLKCLKDGIYAINIISVDPHIKRGDIVNSHLHFDVEYLFEAKEDRQLKIKKDENSGVQWININDVKNVVDEEKMIPLYNRLNEKLKFEKTFL